MKLVHISHSQVKNNNMQCISHPHIEPSYGLFVGRRTHCTHKVIKAVTIKHINSEEKSSTSLLQKKDLIITRTCKQNLVLMVHSTIPFEKLIQSTLPGETIVDTDCIDTFFYTKIHLHRSNNNYNTKKVLPIKKQHSLFNINQLLLVLVIFQMVFIPFQGIKVIWKCCSGFLNILRNKNVARRHRWSMKWGRTFM